MVWSLKKISLFKVRFFNKIPTPGWSENTIAKNTMKNTPIAGKAPKVL